MGIAMRMLIAFLLSILIYMPQAMALSCAGYPNPTACASALSQVDPRNFGAKCLGATWSGGTPHQIGSNDDTQGFVQAEFIAAASGAAVMVPDGCWVQNLPVLTGVTFIGQNWAPNYGFDYGVGSLGYTLNITAGSGYTNGTYLLQASGTVGGPTTCSAINNNCFNLGLKIGNGVTSTTSNTIGTGAQTFTVTSHTALASSTPILIYDNTSVSNGTASNYEFGTVTSDDGTTLVVNVTQTAGSGTITTWTVTNSNWIKVSGGSLGTVNATGYQINQPGVGYNGTVSIPVPAAAGAGTGGNIGIKTSPNGQPFAKPVMYVIGAPTFGINVNGAETVSFVGFEVNAFSNASAQGLTGCIGDDSASQGFGGKIWLYQMSMKGCLTGFKGSSSCFNYLVSENTDYGANTTGIGGCFSDFLSQGDSFGSGAVGISGSGGGFARVMGDRFEYITNGIAPGANAFLEFSIVNTQFDHMDQCAISLGTTWNQITMTGGALKAGGVAGSLTVTGSAASSDGQVELTVTSAIGTIHNGQAATFPFRKVPIVQDTLNANTTIGTGAKTLTTTTSIGYHSRITSTSGTALAGSTTFTDSGIAFAGNAGDILNITSCTGTGCKTGFYRVISNVSTHVITLDRTPTDGVHDMTASNYTSAVPLLIYDNATPTVWEYGTVTSDTGTSLVMNISSVQGSGSTVLAANGKLGNPYWINVNYVGGTTEANGNNQIVTVADGSNIILQNTTWSNVWTSGGYGGVQTLDADICISGNTGSNKANQLTLSNVSFDSTKALGQSMAPAYIIESSAPTSTSADYIGIYGGSLIQAGTSNVAINYTSFSLGVENWIRATPTHYFRQALGMNAIVTPQIMGGTVFGISGCSTTNAVGGAAAGQFVSGTTGTCTPTITMADQGNFPPTNGWVCFMNDLTAGTAIPQTGTTPTTATFSGATTSGDVINFGCTFGY